MPCKLVSLLQKVKLRKNGNLFLEFNVLISMVRLSFWCFESVMVLNELVACKSVLVCFLNL